MTNGSESRKHTPLEEALEAVRTERSGSDRTDAPERLRAEAESLSRWARRYGWRFKGERLVDWLSRLEELEGGAEHDVFYLHNLDRVLKIWATNALPSHDPIAEFPISDYLTSLIRSNELFGDDIRLEGVVDLGHGPQIVISQPFVRGEESDAALRREYFELRGYLATVDDTLFFHPEANEIISDASGRNVLADEDGDVFPIDVHVTMASPEQRGRLLNALLSPI